jgi:predicted 3-demethylubiquinone-9 3-methyltransferase (glyoxalase superfamily)
VQKIKPYLWFDDRAEEAAEFYVSIFENSSIERVSRYGKEGPRPEGMAMVVSFVLDGIEFLALNGGSDSGFSPKPAFYVDCETQAEVDHFWNRLSDGGETNVCGWLTDKFGVAWNVVPSVLPELLGGDDEEGAGRAMKAMLQMTKLDIAELRRAYEDG